MAFKTLNFSTLGPIANNNLDVIPLKAYKILLKLGRRTIVSRLSSCKLVPLCPHFLKLGTQFYDSGVFVWVRGTYVFDAFILLMDQI